MICKELNIFQNSFFVEQQWHILHNVQAQIVKITLLQSFSSIILPLKEVTWRCSIKNVFLKVLQNSKENTYAGVFLNKFADWRPAASPKRLHNLWELYQRDYEIFCRTLWNSCFCSCTYEEPSWSFTVLSRCFQVFQIHWDKVDLDLKMVM